MTPQDAEALKNETNRLINEVMMDATDLEKAVVFQELVRMISEMNHLYPIRVYRMVTEVMHRSLCLLEGIHADEDSVRRK